MESITEKIPKTILDIELKMLTVYMEKQRNILFILRIYIPLLLCLAKTLVWLTILPI